MQKFKLFASIMLAFLATFVVACGGDPAQNITIVLPTITLPDGTEMKEEEIVLDDKCYDEAAKLVVEKDPIFMPSTFTHGHQSLAILNLVACNDVPTVNSFHLTFAGHGVTVADTSNSAKVTNIGFQVAKMGEGVFNYEYWAIDPSTFGMDSNSGVAIINAGRQIDQYGSLNADGDAIGPLFSLDRGQGARMMIFADLMPARAAAGMIEMKVDQFALQGMISPNEVKLDGPITSEFGIY